MIAVGQFFRNTVDNSLFILAATDSINATLIQLSNGNRWTDPTPVGNNLELTADEWWAITGGLADEWEQVSVNITVVEN